MQATAQRRDAQSNVQFNIGEMNNIQRALKKTISCEIGRPGKAVSFLATTGNTTLINKNKILFSDLKGKLEKIYQSGRKLDKIVLLKADNEVFYGHVVKVMGWR